METRTMDLPLKGFGERPSRARVELAALIALPIPIVHLVLVPGAIVLGVVLALVRLRQREIFQVVEGDCPFCGTRQRFTVMGRFRLPKSVHCISCRRQLSLEPPTT